LSDHCPNHAVAAAVAAESRRSAPGSCAAQLIRALLISSTALCASLAFAAGFVIQSPQEGQNLRDNLGHVTVVLALEDSVELPHGLAFRVLLNGRQAAPDMHVKPVMSIPLTGLHRGTHELQALIVDGNGQVLTRSPTVTFTLHQASRLNPP